MFTGLVEAMGTVASVREEHPGRRLAVRTPFSAELAIGESVAINGCCLTVVATGEAHAEFQAGPETLRRTNLGALQAGDLVNLERSLRAEARLGGHLVQGHIDGVATVQSRQGEGEWETIWFDAGELALEMAPKGSVAVDGVSLTLVEATDAAFSVALIPHTLAATTLGFRTIGATVNIETDVLAKYVFRCVRQMSLYKGAAP